MSRKFHGMRLLVDELESTSHKRILSTHAPAVASALLRS